MAETILFSLFVLAVSAYEVPRLLRKRHVKEAVFISFLLLAGFILGIVTTKLIKVPSPLIVLRYIYQPLSIWFFRK
ncbi:hypothetical protein [Paenibacillus mendelii]|uniref:Uncharacterized protein n=1 Tax=Paenibacillus mendelii TaxID=206163 RepID=A0ABV6J8F8_9BACL|nr:hypothetical protein [Paenibacillus mendelii]MCQ6559507.1 hypothetical protein [Paenibacillus mendelii]